MPVVNDFPGLYEKIKARADELAAKAGVLKESVYAYFNKTAHFPTSINELTDFLDQVDPVYKVARRDPKTGRITPIMPGDTPGTQGAKDPGFRHVINNAEDSDIQRFQQVDETGNVFGGSWNKAVNDAHPEWSGKTGSDTGFILGQGGPVPKIGGDAQPAPASRAPASGGGGGVTAPGGSGGVWKAYQDALKAAGQTTRAAQMGGVTAPASQTRAAVPDIYGGGQAQTRSSTSNPDRMSGDEAGMEFNSRGASGMDGRNYVAQTATGEYEVVVDGQVIGTFPSLNDAQDAFNTYGPGGNGGVTAPAAGQPAQPAAGTPVAPSPAGVTAPGSGADSGDEGGSSPFFNPTQEQLRQTAAYNQAQLAYMYAKLDAIDKPYTQAQIDALAVQAAHTAMADALANRKFEQIDLPMLQLQKDQLEQAKTEFSAKYGLERDQLSLSQQQAGQDALLRGADIASREALGRAQMGMEGLSSAEQIANARQATAQQGYLGAEAAGTARANTAQAGFLGAGQLGVARGGLAQSGFQGAEQLARDADAYALQGAQALNDTALQAIGLNAQYRGPRNAWVQQQVNRGLNAQGLTSDVGAIAGEYDPAFVQAPQAAPQAASLGTGVADMLGAGGQPGPGAQPSANQIIRNQIQSRIADPYGAGGRAMMGQAAQYAGDEYGEAGRQALGQAGQIASDYYGAGGRAALGQAGQLDADPYGQAGRTLIGQANTQLANQYSSPSSQAAMAGAQQGYDAASNAIQAAQQSEWQRRLQGSGQRVLDDYGRMTGQLGRPPTQAEVDRMIAVETGFTPEQVASVNQTGRNYRWSTGQPATGDVLDRAFSSAVTAPARRMTIQPSVFAGGATGQAPGPDMMPGEQFYQRRRKRDPAFAGVTAPARRSFAL